MSALKNNNLYLLSTGPAGQALGKGKESVPRRLKALTVEIGIITGNLSMNPLSSSLIKGTDDGKVSVEEAKLSEMKDFLILPTTHTYIMRNSEAMKQALNFIENGLFD